MIGDTRKRTESTLFFVTFLYFLNYQFFYYVVPRYLLKIPCYFEYLLIMHNSRYQAAAAASHGVCQAPSRPTRWALAPSPPLPRSTPSRAASLPFLVRWRTAIEVPFASSLSTSSSSWKIVKLRVTPSANQSNYLTRLSNSFSRNQSYWFEIPMWCSYLWIPIYIIGGGYTHALVARRGNSILTASWISRSLRAGDPYEKQSKSKAKSTVSIIILLRC